MSDRLVSPGAQPELFPPAPLPSLATDGSLTLARIVSDFARDFGTGTQRPSAAALEVRINDAAFAGQLSAFRPGQRYIRSLVAAIKRGDLDLEAISAPSNPEGMIDDLI